MADDVIDKIEDQITEEKAKPNPDSERLARLEEKIDKLMATPIAPAPAPTPDPVVNDEPPTVEPDAAPPTPAKKSRHGASRRWFGGDDDDD